MREHRAATIVSGLLVTLAYLWCAQAEQQSGIVVRSTALVVDDKPAGTLAAGTSISILGEKADSAELIVQQSLPDGQTLVGLVPKSAIVLSKSATTAPAVEEKAALPLPDVFEALDLSRRAKDDREGFNASYKGRSIKVSGVVEKGTIETVPGSNEKQPVITLASSSGLPRVKVRMSPAIARSNSIISEYRYFPDWFYGYYGRKLEFRQSGLNQIQVRASYKRSSSYSDGSTYSSKHSSDWSPIFSPGDNMTIEGTVKGVGVDVEIEGALLISPRR